MYTNEKNVEYVGKLDPPGHGCIQQNLNIPVYIARTEYSM